MGGSAGDGLLPREYHRPRQHYFPLSVSLGGLSWANWAGESRQGAPARTGQEFESSSQPALHNANRDLTRHLEPSVIRPGGP